MFICFFRVKDNEKNLMFGNEEKEELLIVNGELLIVNYE